MNKYKVASFPMGMGGGGMAVEVTNKEGQTFVMKQKRCFTLDDANSGVSEGIALARFQHENIVSFEDIFIHAPSDNQDCHYYLCIVMEYCNGGNLFDFLLNYDSNNATYLHSPSLSNSSSSSSSLLSPGRSPSLSNPPKPSFFRSSPSPSPSSSQLSPLAVASSAPSPSISLSSSFSSSRSDSVSSISIVEKELLPKFFVVEWMRQLCNGVHAIHAARLVHRDLKSENIFLTHNNVLKIGVFGLTALNYNDKAKAMTGSYFYSSPEILRDKIYEKPGDIFALGCIFYEMATLKLHPSTKTCFGDMILKNTFDRAKFINEFPEDCKDIGELALKMLNESPELRPTIDAILKDPIFSSTPTNTQPNVTIDKFFDSQTEGFGIRQLLLPDGPAFAAVMARAYSNDPLFLHVVRKKTNKEEVLRAIFKQAFKMFQVKGYSVWGYFDTNKKLLAISVWVPPDHDDRRSSLSDLLHVAFSSKVVTTVGLSSIRRFRENAKRIQEVSKEKDCWHLMYCAVDPDHQNKKIGESLCKPVLHWADQEKTVITACLFNERPFHFLQKLGFEMQTMQKRDEKEIPLWYFKRSPKTT